MVAGGDGADCDEEKNRRDARTERDGDGGGVGRGVQRMHVTTVPRLPSPRQEQRRPCEQTAGAISLLLRARPTSWIPLHLVVY